MLRVTCTFFLFLVFVELDHLNRGFSDYTTIHDFHLYQQEMFWQIVSTGPSSVFVFGLFKKKKKWKEKRKTLTHKAFYSCCSFYFSSFCFYLFIFIFIQYYVFCQIFFNIKLFETKTIKMSRTDYNMKLFSSIILADWLNCFYCSNLS